MGGLFTGLIVTIHIFACIALMIAILLQSGKGGGLAGAFGGGSSQTLFGGRGAAGFLSRATTVLAIVFFLTSLTLGVSASRSSGRRSLVQEDARRRAGSAPVGSGPSAPAPGASAPLGGGTAAPAPPAGGTTAPPSGAPAPSTSAPTTPAPTTPAPSTPASGSGSSPSTGGQ